MCCESSIALTKIEISINDNILMLKKYVARKMGIPVRSLAPPWGEGPQEGGGGSFCHGGFGGVGGKPLG